MCLDFIAVITVFVSSEVECVQVVLRTAIHFYSMATIQEMISTFKGQEES